VWATPMIPAPGQKPGYGWNNPFLVTCFPRPEAPPSTGPLLDSGGVPLVRHRILSEGLQAAGLHGFGRVGADFWPVLKDAQGRLKANLAGRFPESSRASIGINQSGPPLLAPGPDGAASTVRFEMIREGVQECEARICIERALLESRTAGKLDAKLAGRCQDLLSRRDRAMVLGGWQGWLWFLSSGWQERDEELYELAGEVSRAAAGR